MGAVSRATHEELPIRTEYWTDRGALAHSHQDKGSQDSRTHVPEGLAGNESSGCAAARAEASRQSYGHLATKPCGSYRIAHYRDHCARASLHAVSLRGAELESADPGRIRSLFAAAEL